MGNKLFVKSASLAFGEISQEGVGENSRCAVLRCIRRQGGEITLHSTLILSVLLCELGLYKVSGVCMGGSE